MLISKVLKKIWIVGLLAGLTVACGDDDSDDNDDTQQAAELASPGPEQSSIVDIAVGNEQFSTLVTALQKAELVETLQGEGPFTVFAPVNDAFAAIDPQALEALLADKAALTNVLLYHVIAGAVPAEEAVKLTSATMVNGDTISLMVKEDGLYLNENTKVITTDIQASNGIIHVIDTVLLP